MAEIAVKSPMTGIVIEVLVSPGESVGTGDILLVIESMKMENEILSEHEGTVKEVKVSLDQNISEGDTVVTLETT